MALRLSGDGNITGINSLNTDVSATELGYLDGISSSVQTQINTSGGLVYLHTENFSAASSVIINNIFSDAYDNYRVLVDISQATATGYTSLRLRSGGVDSAIGYYKALSFVTYSSATVNGEYQNNATGFNACYVNSTYGGKAVSDILNPALPARTHFTQFVWNTGQNPGWGGGEHSVASSYDGFTLIPVSGTITGTVYIYGYRNS